MEAPAKVNLFLRVLGRRPDGFHELQTLFQAVSLCDRVTLEPGAPGVELTVSSSDDLGPVEENLAYRAVTAFAEATGWIPAVHVSLDKRIPAGAGLGGGSSDAGAVLRGLRALTVRGSDELLLQIAAELGSDVPFFAAGDPLAVGTGRGEALQPIAPWPTGHLVIVMPPVHVATAGAYAALAAARSDGEPVPPPVAGWPTGWAELESMAVNDFESVVASQHEEIARSLDALRAAGARIRLLSGSGAACFGAFESRGSAAAAADSLTLELGWRCEAVETSTGSPPLTVEP